MMERAFGPIGLLVKDRSPLLLWICLFLATRLYTLYFGLGYAWTDEEYFRGTIAREFLGFFHGQGLRLPLWEYQADTYLGGTLLVGFITAINYFFFGVNLLSLKLTAIYFSLGALVLTYLWLRRDVSARAADTFALFYVLASPGFISLGLISMGYHTESVFFVACSLVLGYRIQQRPQSGWSYVLFGLVSGLGFWFSFINGITTAAVALALALSPNFRREVRIRALLLFVAGILAGLAPWFYFNWNFHLAGWRTLTGDFMVTEDKAYYPGRSFLYLKARKMFVLFEKDFAYFQRFSFQIVSYVFLGLLLLLAAGFDRQRNRFLSTFLAAYAAVYLASYAITNRMIFQNEEIVSHRYLMNLFFLVTVMVSLQRRFTSARFLVAASAACILSLLGLYEHFDTYLPIHRLSPVSLTTLSEKLAMENFTGKDLPAFLEVARSYPREEQPYFLAGLRYFDQDGIMRLSDSVVQDGLRSLDPAGRNFLLRRLGGIYADANLFPPPESEFPLGAADRKEFLRGYVESDVASDRESRDRIRPWAEELERWRAFYRGYWKIANSCRAQLPGSDPWLLRGIGSGIRGCESSLRTAFREIATLHEPASLPQYAWGIGWDLRHKYLQDPDRGFLLIRTLPESFQSLALAGARSFEQYFGISTAASILRLSDKNRALP